MDGKLSPVVSKVLTKLNLNKAVGGLQLCPTVKRFLMASFTVHLKCQALQSVAQINLYPSKLAIQLSVQYVQLN